MALETKYYFDFSFPLKVVQLILGLIFGGPKSEQPTVDPANREWFSQPRLGTDPGVECVTTIFKLPLSVSEISVEILRVPCFVEIWYQDRSNNWRPMLDMSRLPLRVPVSFAGSKSYYKYSSKVYPIVAKQVQFRIVRTNDATLEDSPYVVGMRNALIRRNVYDRSQGTQYFEDEIDVLGNVISKYIKDWDATKAVDDDPYTFWKSAPMPDPNAVTSLYLDVRSDHGEPSTIDRLYIDPVYSGVHLNLYYTSDETVGTRKLNPVTINPDADENTIWMMGSGRSDVSSGTGESFYRWSMGIGPQALQDAWIGIEWTPDFDPASGPPENPVLYRTLSHAQVTDWIATETDPDRLAMLDDLATRVPPDITGVFRPQVYYDVGAGTVVLEFYDGTDARTYAAVPTEAFTPGDTLRIIAGWRYGTDEDTVHIEVVNQAGTQIAFLDSHPTTLPGQVSFDGEQELYRFRGRVSALVVKLESYELTSPGFLNSATYYVDPDPVIPDPNTGVIPSTTLDNAIYAVDWTTQQDGSGGSHESVYENKEWTPIWRNYVTEKGMLFFPQAIAMKYLKLEFTNLCEQPYPIYESGVETRYRVYPTSVVQQSTIGPRLYTGEGGFLGLGTFISVNGVKSVNWLNPLSVLAAIGSTVSPQTPPVAINTQNGYTTDSLPNQSTGPFAASDHWRLEMGSTYVYKRDAIQPYIMATDAYVTTIKAEGLQKLAELGDVPWSDIEAANPGAITHVKSLGTIGIRGTDWWIYPGQQLKIPANVMAKMVDSETITERKLTLEHRVRFNTTSVHRYDYKTVKRDAAIAYFAALREVQPYTTTFVDGEDQPSFTFPSYDPAQFTLANTTALESGPTTTTRRQYTVENLLFERDILNWAQVPDNGWSWDGTTGRWLWGAAKTATTGTRRTLMSNIQTVNAGEAIDVGSWVKWTGLTPNPGAVAFQLAVMEFAGNLNTGLAVVDQITYTDWSTHAASSAPADNDFIAMGGTYTVPTGVDRIRVLLVVTDHAPLGGTVWFDSVTLREHTPPDTLISKTLTTTSTFSKVGVDFTDSGLWRSDSMWADIVPDSQSISDIKLAPYTRTVPETIPGGFWGDTIKTWAAEDAYWGSPASVVSVVIDSNRIYDGKRVLHFRRAGGSGSFGEAGVKVTQWTHYVPKGLFRMGAVFYKPNDNSNQVTLRLRRLADGVIIREKTFSPPTGRWVTYTTDFMEIPDTVEQDYEVQFVTTGDDADEIYLNDLYTEVSQIRYYVRLGDPVTGTLHEVTDLRYADGRAYVVATNPVTQVSLQVQILAPESWVYGCTLTPNYLK